MCFSSKLFTKKFSKVRVLLAVICLSSFGVVIFLKINSRLEEICTEFNFTAGDAEATGCFQQRRHQTIAIMLSAIRGVTVSSALVLALSDTCIYY
jgi:hypothetical protein